MNGSNTYNASSFGYAGGGLKPAKIRKRLRPLLERLQAIDALRARIETEGGSGETVGDLTRLFIDPIRCRGKFKKCKLSLTNPRGLQQSIVELTSFRVKFTVRRLDNKFPAYYLCRTRSDFWAEYTFVIEDLYRSPRYPMRDDRFVPIMRYGKETQHLRLSQFRAATADLLSDLGESSDDVNIDAALYSVGIHVLQAAWHEDHLPGLTAAVHFNLPALSQTIELLYLCLSGDLWTLRDAVRSDPLIPSFFEHVYQQPLIRELLVRLTVLGNSEIKGLREDALTAYVDLCRAFSEFLHTEILWGARRQRQPLFKAVFGNFDRLAIVAEALAADTEFLRARERLEPSTGEIAQRLLSRAGVQLPMDVTNQS